MKQINKPLPMPQVANEQQVSPVSQMAIFLSKNVKIEYTVNCKEALGRLQNVTGMFVVILRADGRHKLIKMDTIVSIEEAQVDQSMLAS